MLKNKRDGSKNMEKQGSPSQRNMARTSNTEEEEDGEWGWSALAEDDSNNEDSLRNVLNGTSVSVDPNVNIEVKPKSPTVMKALKSNKSGPDEKTGKPAIKGISSSPSFQELEKAIAMSLASDNNSQETLAGQQQHGSKHSSTDLTQIKIQQQRIRQQQKQNNPHHLQSRTSNPNLYQFNQYSMQQQQQQQQQQHQQQHPVNSVPARVELVNFINESESRAIILFHSANTSPINIRNACSKYGVLYYIRPEFHGKGVTLLSYFDLRAATTAFESISKVCVCLFTTTLYYLLLPPTPTNLCYLSPSLSSSSSSSSS